MVLTLSDNAIFEILGGIYDNARCGNSDSWLKTYTDIAKLTSSGTVSITVLMAETGRFETVATDLDETEVKEYNEHYQFSNPLRGPIEKLKPGEVFYRSQYLNDRELEKTDIYQNWFKRLDIYELCYFALGHLRGMSGGFTLTRPKSNPRYSESEMRVLEYLIPHIDRAFFIYLHLRQAEHENRQMTETLRRMPQSVIVVDSAGTVIFRNESAERLVEQKDGLAVDRGRLRGASAADTKKLNSAISASFALDGGRLVESRGVVQLSRPSGKRPLQVLISPFFKLDCPAYEGENLALVIVFDPEMKPVTEEEILRSVYSLTPAEARLASLIVKGLSLKEAAVVLEVSENTVRTHLKRIFSKTDTKRQSEIINLVLNGPANLKNHSL